MLGLWLGAPKSKPPCTRIWLLGAEIALRSDSIDASAPDRRRGELVGYLQKILESGRFAPALAAQLRGMLGFAQSLMLACVGRAPQAPPLSDRQYANILATR